MKRMIIFGMILWLASCTNRTSIPANIIPLDSMQKIMKDLIVAGEYSIEYISKDSTKRDKVKANQDLLETIFKIHYTTKDIFKKSLSFYESRPDLNKIIFDSLAADANRHRPELYAPKKPPIRIKALPVKKAL